MSDYERDARPQHTRPISQGAHTGPHGGTTPPADGTAGPRITDLSPEQFTGLFEEAVRVVRGKGRPLEDAKDHVGAAVARLCENPVPLRSPRSMLIVAAMRVGIADWRKPRGEPLGEADRLLADPSVERDRERAELTEEVWAAIRRLPVDWRCAVVMEMEGVPRAVIAERCRCHPNTVRSRLAAAHERLRELLRDRLSS